MFNTGNPDANFSLISGLRFRFTVNGKELLYLASTWTGKESILYDGKEISSIQSYKRKNSHNFVIDDVAYKATLAVDSLLKGSWHCRLYRNKRMVKCFHIYYKEESLFEKLLQGGVIGFVAIFTPKSLWFICIPLIGIAVFRKMKNLVCKVYFGEENHS